MTHRSALSKSLALVLLLLLVTTFSAFGPTTAAFADDNEIADLHPILEWDIGYELTYFKYEETSGGSELMQEDGILNGLHAALTYHSEGKPLMWRAEGRFAGGELDYDGQTWGGDPVTADTDDFILGLRGLVGWDCEHERFASTLFSGLGYRYWNDEIDGLGGYEREISWLYIPVGVEAATPLNEHWIFGASVEGDVLAYGWVKSHLSDAVPGFNDPTVKQDFGSGYGVQTFIYLKRQTKGPISWSIGVFADYWDIDESDEETLTYYGILAGWVVEPDNETTQVGVRASLHW